MESRVRRQEKGKEDSAEEGGEESGEARAVAEQRRQENMVMVCKP